MSNKKDDKLRGMLAMSYFAESNFEYIHVKGNGQGGFECSISGQSFGVLGACAIVIKNLCKEHDIPFNVATSFIEDILPALDQYNDDNFDEEQEDTLIEQLEQFYNRKNNKE